MAENTPPRPGHGGGGTEPGVQIDSFLCNCAAWLRSAGSLQLHPAGSCTETAPPFPFFLSLFYSLFFSICLRTDLSSSRHFNTILPILCTSLFAHTHTPDCFNLTLIRPVCQFTHFPDGEFRSVETANPADLHKETDYRLCGGKSSDSEAFQTFNKKSSSLILSTFDSSINVSK